jgi:hypothetical protein
LHQPGDPHRSSAPLPPHSPAALDLNRFSENLVIHSNEVTMSYLSEYTRKFEKSFQLAKKLVILGR